MGCWPEQQRRRTFDGCSTLRLRGKEKRKNASGVRHGKASVADDFALGDSSGRTNTRLLEISREVWEHVGTRLDGNRR